MGYLDRVEHTVTNTVQLLLDKSQPATTERCWSVFHLGYDMIVINWFDDAPDILDTLISLLSNSDRRVMLLAVLYIGIIQEFHGRTRGWEDSERAIAPLWRIARGTKDNNIGIAVGITNAILGDAASVSWMTQQMKAIGESSDLDFRKYNRLNLVQEIANGWK